MNMNMINNVNDLVSRSRSTLVFFNFIIFSISSCSSKLPRRVNIIELITTCNKMSVKRTFVDLWHSTNNDSAHSINQTYQLRGTRSDKNVICGSVGLTKIWTCAS